MSIDLILFHGKIYTVDDERPWVTAVAIHDNRIVAVGSDEEILALTGGNTRIIDLEERLILPGLCDAHIHLYDWALAREQVQCAGTRSRSEMQEAIFDWLRENPDAEWICGKGWNEGLWSNESLPTRHDLDKVTGFDRPAIFWRSDMHAAVANSAALARAGIMATTPDPPGGIIGRESSGEPSGMLWELAINKVCERLPDPGQEMLDTAIQNATGSLQRLGITSVHDQRMKDQPEGPAALAAYQRLMMAGKLGMRVSCNIAAHDFSHLKALGLKSGFGNNYLRLGHVKFFADGSMGSQTAWMLTPYGTGRYKDSEFSGIPLTPPKEMANEMANVIEAGFPVSVHAIGDRAIKTVLDIFEEMPATYLQTRTPSRIEHVQIIDPKDRARLGQLNLTASVQPIHLLDDMETAKRVLGDRVDRIYNFKGISEGGARLALGSDAPVADPNPWLGFHAAIFRQWPAQMAEGPFIAGERISLEQTIRGYTLGAAEAAGWEDTIGSIRPDKLADMVVLDRDLFTIIGKGVEKDEIAGTQVWMTIFDGKVVHSSDDIARKNTN